MELKYFLVENIQKFKSMVKDGSNQIDFKIASQNLDNNLFSSEIDKKVLISFKSVNFKHKYAKKYLYKSDLSLIFFLNLIY